jgi:hypothetical protein
MTELYLDGGLFMYPILFVSMVGMAIMIERWFTLNRVRSVNRRMRGLSFHAGQGCVRPQTNPYGKTGGRKGMRRLLQEIVTSRGRRY